MASYKTPYTTISIAGHSKHLPSWVPIKVLTYDHNLVGLSKSMLDSQTGNAYKVPTGKSFRFLGLRIEHNATVGGLTKLYSSTTIDTSTSLLYTFHHGAFNGWSDYALDGSLPTGTYLASDPQTNIWTANVLGYEFTGAVFPT